MHAILNLRLERHSTRTHVEAILAGKRVELRHSVVFSRLYNRKMRPIERRDAGRLRGRRGR